MVQLWLILPSISCPKRPVPSIICPDLKAYSIFSPGPQNNIQNYFLGKPQPTSPFPLGKHTDSALSGAIIEAYKGSLDTTQIRDVSFKHHSVPTLLKSDKCVLGKRKQECFCLNNGDAFKGILCKKNLSCPSHSVEHWETM